MVKKRTHIVIPAAVVAEIDTLVGKRGRSRFLTEIATQEVKRLRLLRALERPTPAWKDKDHPELKAGAAAWIRKLRRQDDKRFRRIENR
ncbi:MAG: hypothetical protein HY238_25645 [Acidobacteria bacterium]|nr:hypothetical protein [Acidobacteriota bacterium]